MNRYLQAYMQNDVTTASPKTIIVRLHEKALVDVQQAHQAWQNHNLDVMRTHITYIQDIISYFHTSLDPSVEVSDTLAGLYRYYLVRLANIFVDPSEEAFAEVKQFLEEWTATWRKAE
ncbi:flagellar export chaperone FliS [Alicyclobacillus curvatus]|nr:flagellar export chaperone FliS [Alicyclobacillus curvatus]